MKSMRKKLMMLLAMFCVTVSALVLAAGTNVEADGLVTDYSIKMAPNQKDSYLTGETYTIQMVLATNSDSTETMSDPISTVTIPKAFVNKITIGESPSGTDCAISEDSNNFYATCKITQLVGGYSLSFPINVTTQNLSTPEGSIVHVTGTLSDGKTTVQATPLNTTLHVNGITMRKTTCPLNGSCPANIKGDDGVLIYAGQPDPSNLNKISSDVSKLNYVTFAIDLPDISDPAPFGTRGFETLTITDTLPANTYFDPSVNKGWVDNGNGTVSYTVNKDTVAPNTTYLKLKTPGATINETANPPYTYTNRATVTIVPLNKAAGEPNITDSDISSYNVTGRISTDGMLNKTELVPSEQEIDNLNSIKKVFTYSLMARNLDTIGQDLKNFQFTEKASDLDSRLKFSSLTFYRDFTTSTQPTSLTPPAINEGGSVDVYVVVNGAQQFVTNVPAPTDSTTINLPNTDNIQQVIIKAHDSNTVIPSGSTFYVLVNTLFRNQTSSPLANSGSRDFYNTFNFTSYTADSNTNLSGSVKTFFTMNPYNPEIWFSKNFSSNSKFPGENALLGDTVTYQFQANTSKWIAGDQTGNLQIIDLLPQGLAYIPGSTQAFANATFDYSNIAEPKVISNFKNTGRVALVWELGNYQVKDSVQHTLFSFSFDAKVTQAVNKGTVTNDSYMTWENNNLITPLTSTNVTPYTDALDLDSDGNKSETFIKDPIDFNYVPPETLITTKEVQGSLDNEYLMSPNTGLADFNDTVKWRLTANNTNSIQDVNDLTIIDVLPYVGDTTLSLNMSKETMARNSAFKTILTGPVVMPGGSATYVAYYNTKDFTGMDANQVNSSTGWVTSVSDWSSVTAVKIVMTSGSLLKGSSTNFILNAKLPPKSADLNAKVAYNSFATSINSSQPSFFESNIDGVKANGPEPSQINIEKAVDKDIANVNDVLTYTLKVKNSSTITSASYTLNDVLDSKINYLASSITIDGTSVTDAIDTDAGAYNSTSKTVNAKLANIAPGVTKTIVFKATINSTALGKDIPNQATMTPDDENVGAVDPSNKVDTIVPDITADKAVDKTLANVGDTLTYTLKVNNNSDFEVKDYTLNDILDTAKIAYDNNSMRVNNISVTDSATDTDNASYSNNTLNVKFPTITANSTMTITFTARVLAGAAGDEITNKATITPPEDYPDVPDTDIVVTKVPGLELTKSVDKKTAIIGDTLTYTLLLNNKGSIASGAYTISDVIDTTKVSYITGTMSIDGVNVTDAKDSDSGNMDGKTLNASTTNLAGGKTLEIKFQVTVLETGKGTKIPNVGVAIPSDPDQPDVPSNEVETIVPDLTANKVVDKAVAKIGDTLTYTITLRNNSDFAVNDYALKDVIDNSKITYTTNSIKVNNINYTDAADTDNVSFANNTINIKFNTIGVNQTMTITFTAKVLAGAAGEEITNKATIDSPKDYPKVPDTEIVITEVPDLELIKTVDKETAVVGDTLTYTLTLRNKGTIDSGIFTINDAIKTDKVRYLANTLLFADNSSTITPTMLHVTDAKDTDRGNMDGTTLNATTANLTKGNSFVVQFKVVVLEASKGQAIPNIGIATPNDPNLKDINSNEVITVVPDITTSKVVDKNHAKVGDTLTYTIKVNNNSDFEVNDYILKDTIDASKLAYNANSMKINNIGVTDSVTDADNASFNNNTLNINFVSIAGNTTMTVTFAARVLDGADGQEITNKATLDSPEDYPDVPDTDIVTTKVPDLELIKAVDKPDAIVGDTLTYTLLLNNKGEVDSSAYTVNDIIDTTKVAYLENSIKVDGMDATDAKDSDNASMDGTTLTVTTDNLDAHKSLQIIFKVTALEASKGQAIPNSSIAVPDDPNLEDIDSNEVVTLIPDVSIVKAVDKEVAQVGDNLNYTFTITNNGVTNLENLVLYDELSNYLSDDGIQVIDIPTLAPGESVEFTFEDIHNILDPALGKIIDNMASIKIKNGDENTKEDYTDNSTVTDSNVVHTRVPDVTINKDVDATEANVDQDLTYTIKINNNSEFTINDYLVLDKLNLTGDITYVKNSMKVDNQAVSDAKDTDLAHYSNQTVNVSIPEMLTKQTITITFKVHLGINSGGEVLNNTARLEDVNTKVPNLPGRDSNTVKTTVTVPNMPNTGRVAGVPNTGSTYYLIGILTILLGTGGIYILKRQKA